MSIKIISLALFLVSSVSHAETINSITIFQTNTVGIIQDIPLSKNHEIEIFNMDTKDNATLRLNKLIKQRLPKTTTNDYALAYTEAFDEVLNGEDWSGVYEELEKGSKAIELAIRYRVKKTPAIVFNNSSVIYGVTSLKEAIEIYNIKVN